MSSKIFAPLMQPLRSVRQKTRAPDSGALVRLSKNVHREESTWVPVGGPRGHLPASNGIEYPAKPCQARRAVRRAGTFAQQKLRKSNGIGRFLLLFQRLQLRLPQRGGGVAGHPPRRRKVRYAPFPPDGENYARSLAPPLPTARGAAGPRRKATGSSVPDHSSVSSSACHSAAEASLGIRQSPRGDRAAVPTLGPSGTQLRLNCWEKNRR